MVEPGARFFGWERGTSPGSLRVRVGGTTVGTFDDATNDLVLPTNGLTVTAGGIAVTAGGVTVTAGGQTITAGGLTVTAGNANLGGAGTFATTQPDMALILNSGTAPVGAITTAGGIFATDTAINKIIAAGTANTIQT